MAPSHASSLSPGSECLGYREPGEAVRRGGGGPPTPLLAFLSCRIAWKAVNCRSRFTFVNRTQILFGAVAAAVGVSIGYLMIARPEGLNPSWPVGVALLAPALFLLAGVHLLSAGLGFPRVSVVAIRAVLVAFLAIGNWAAFFTAHVPCRNTVSFFGVPLVSRAPTDAACRSQLRGIMIAVDAIALAIAGIAAWQKSRSRSPEAVRDRP